MTMTLDDLRSSIGREVIDRSGERSGKVESVFYDTKTNEPAWLAVHMGLFGRHSTLVPLAGAKTEGDTIVVPFDKETIKAAPEIEEDRPIDSREAAELFKHYGLGGRPSEGQATDEGRATGQWQTTQTTDEPQVERQARGDRAASQQDRAASQRAGATDEAMTRSEEELFVGTETSETGHARLRKWVETEPVDRTITLTHEEARVVREPITEDNVDQAMEGPDLAESEFEVTLHEEHAVVDKRVMPKERVRLETEKVTEQQEIHDELRKERIEFEDDSSPRKQR